MSEMKHTDIEVLRRVAVRLRQSGLFNDASFAGRLEDIASRLQALAVAEDGWQPIETAPQDGTQVLAPCGYGFLDVLTYSDGAWRETSNLLRARHQPTVWQPLPAAPALRTGGSE
tara:strand:- start:2649 stop:2993 length:345 start_codon:yes stop_codon:yes gene_type:complete